MHASSARCTCNYIYLLISFSFSLSLSLSLSLCIIIWPFIYNSVLTTRNAITWYAHARSFRAHHGHLISHVFSCRTYVTLAWHVTVWPVSNVWLRTDTHRRTWNFVVFVVTRTDFQLTPITPPPSYGWSTRWCPMIDAEQGM